MSRTYSSPNPRSRSRSRAGPLASDIKGFADLLAAEAFARSTIETKLATVRGLGSWLESEGLTVEALDEKGIEAFLRTREPSRRRGRGEAGTCRLLLKYLRAEGRIPALAIGLGRESPTDRTVRTYERFLINERGLGRAAISNYVPVARAFLADRFGTNPIALGQLSARDANQFVLRQASRLSPSSCKLVVTALRSFLRHLHQRGDLAADLASAVLAVRLWRLSSLPKALRPEQVEALLDSCDTGTPVGRRDRAVLLLLARLGLRSGEVTALTLDDFDWRAGVVTVSGKGQRREPLPLPREVGEAVANYLQVDRPQCATRRLFVRTRAPFRGLHASGAVYQIMRRAVDRAGLDLPGKGPHALRHSLATEMLRHGASLENIGQLLRHSHPNTTQIYAKVDLEALRRVAPVWPGGAS